LTNPDLKAYQSRRNFDETPEPRPVLGAHEGRLIFVVQQHAARALHYDLRLELEGVLKSWAVPKGPSLNPTMKRLAVQVEDHPLDYQDFEGVIPEGNYGAGSVIVWDRGFYQHPAAQDGRESEELLLVGLRQGNLKFVLAGEKLKGEFALVRTKKDEKSWLLLKKKDGYASNADILQENRSVMSGKTLAEVAAAGTQGAPREPGRIRTAEALESLELQAAPVRPMPPGMKPMLATLVKEPFDDPAWSSR
jgi:bifunctional non-homologous end joining protein LigD